MIASRQPVFELLPIRAVTTVCPYRRRVVVELWAGVEPMLPANLYLRHLLDEKQAEEGTLRRKASRLKPFCAFLRQRHLSFWDPVVRLGGHRMIEFKISMVDRASGRASGDAAISFRYVRDVLGDVYELCKYFQQKGEDFEGQQTAQLVMSRSAVTTRSRIVQARPHAFNVKLPPEERARRPNVMTPGDVDLIWDLLGRATAPKPSRDVVVNPRARSDWSPKRKQEWQRAKLSFALELARHRRRRMLWSLMIGAGMRREEFPLLMNRDVKETFGEITGRMEIWISLCVRDEHRHLGRAKTGHRLMYLGGDERHFDALNAWQESRAVLVGEWVARSGQVDHGMFLTNHDGSPLSGDGVEYLCDWVNGRIGEVGDEGYGTGGFKLHPHACRHTMKALMSRARVHPDIIQAQMGHKHQHTTQQYGKEYRDAIVAGVQQMEQHFRTVTL